jgi:CRP-like cAMP-binding protein
VLAGVSGDERHRIGSFSPGTLFGEIAFLDAGLRSAFAVADDDVVCYVLTPGSFERLRKERPEFAVTLLANLSLDLARRLRTASTEIRTLRD